MIVIAAASYEEPVNATLPPLWIVTPPAVATDPIWTSPPAVILSGSEIRPVKVALPAEMTVAAKPPTKVLVNETDPEPVVTNEVAPFNVTVPP